MTQVFRSGVHLNGQPQDLHVGQLVRSDRDGFATLHRIIRVVNPDNSTSSGIGVYITAPLDKDGTEAVEWPGHILHTSWCATWWLPDEILPERLRRQYGGD